MTWMLKLAECIKRKVYIHHSVTSQNLLMDPLVGLFGSHTTQWVHLGTNGYTSRCVSTWLSLPTMDALVSLFPPTFLPTNLMDRLVGLYQTASLPTDVFNYKWIHLLICLHLPKDTLVHLGRSPPMMVTSSDVWRDTRARGRDWRKLSWSIKVEGTFNKIFPFLDSTINIWKRPKRKKERYVCMYVHV